MRPNLLDLIRGTAISKTMRFNGLLGVLWGLFSSGTLDMDAANTFLQSVFGGNPEIMALIGAIGVIGNFFMRAVTKEPLAERAKK